MNIKIRFFIRDFNETRDKKKYVINTERGNSINTYIIFNFFLGRFTSYLCVVLLDCWVGAPNKSQ